MELRIDLNEPKIRAKVTSDRFGLFTSKSWKDLLDKYTPRDTGLLLQNVELRPWEIEYKQPYAHYVYEGELYVDPQYGCGGFYSLDYGFWSRPRVKKKPSGQKLNFQSPGTDHWDLKAAKAGQLDKLYRTLNNALNSGQF